MTGCSNVSKKDNLVILRNKCLKNRFFTINQELPVIKSENEIINKKVVI